MLVRQGLVLQTTLAAALSQATESQAVRMSRRADKQTRGGDAQARRPKLMRAKRTGERRTDADNRSLSARSEQAI